MTVDHYQGKYEQLVRHMQEWVWERCPGCGRKSNHHPDTNGLGEWHSDGCPLEGMYGHKHEWWFEREIARLTGLLREKNG